VFSIQKTTVLVITSLKHIQTLLLLIQQNRSDKPVWCGARSNSDRLPSHWPQSRASQAALPCRSSSDKEEHTQAEVLLKGIHCPSKLPT